VPNREATTTIAAGTHVWPEGAHAFANMATPLGDLAAERATNWITATLNAAALDDREPALG
jgi:hypothetical protein